ncbi:bacteriohemerythrin [Pseudomonadota bacterium]
MNTEFIEITWTKDLETGIDVLDAQHHRYFDLLSKYIAKAAKVAKKTSDIRKVLDLAETLNFLREYAQEHFSTEEAVMKEAAYTDFEQHKEEHRYFLKHVDELYNEMKTAGYSVRLAAEVEYYTAEWFVAHIRSVDMKLVQFLREKSTEDNSLTLFLKKIYESILGQN